jgi:hypothetical protein
LNEEKHGPNGAQGCAFDFDTTAHQFGAIFSTASVGSSDTLVGWNQVKWANMKF